MNDYFRKALTTSRVYLVDNVDYDSLRDFLIESETLPASVIENIDSNPNRRQRLREMLDCLPRRSDLAFSTFLVSLYKSNQQHIAHKLYDQTCSLIDSSHHQLREVLENTIQTILASSSPSSSITAGEHRPVENNRLVSHTKRHQIPIENSCVPIQEQQSSLDRKGQEHGHEAMDEEASFISKENESKILSLKSGNYSKSCSFPSTFKNEAKESFACSSSSSSFPSQPKQQSEDDLVYQMDSSPRGLLCIITTAKGSKLKDDSLPVPQQNDKETQASHTTGDRSVTLERDAELQSLFWQFGFYSCVIELADATYHPDKLGATILQFAQLPLHGKADCCAIAMLGFSGEDLHLSKILSWFNNENCPHLAGKPKLFIIQVPGDDTTPSDLMSGVELPKDSLVAVGLEETNTQPGLVTSLFHVCQQQQQQMDQPRYSMQEIFKQVQQFNIAIAKRTVEVKKSLTKLWIVDSHCKLEKQDPL